MLLLEIIRDGRRRLPIQLFNISDDVQGNLDALSAMATIVREDVAEPDLRAFVMREVVGDVGGHQHNEEIQACFEFARDEIVYRRDPVGVERVVDMWSCLYALNPEQPEGDCGIKSVFLATCLGLLGQTPFFVVMTESPSADSYSHLYVGTIFRNKALYLDPTPENFEAGQQPPGLVHMVYPIFEETREELKSLAGS